jgi:hypothetical protein
LSFYTNFHFRVGSSGTVDIGAIIEDLSVGKLTTGSDPLPVRREASPSPSTSSQRPEHERKKSDGNEKITRNSLETPNSHAAEEVVDFGRTEKRSSSNAVKNIISHFISGAGSVQVIQVY